MKLILSILSFILILLPSVAHTDCNDATLNPNGFAGARDSSANGGYTDIYSICNQPNVGIINLHGATKIVLDDISVGSGTLSSNGVVVTGDQTNFTYQLHSGDVLIAAGQTRVVGGVNSDLSITTTTTFNPPLPIGTTYTYLGVPFAIIDTGANRLAIFTALGDLGLGLNRIPQARLDIGQSALPTVTVGNGLSQSRVLNVAGGAGGESSDTGATGGAGAEVNIAAGGGGLATGTNGHGGTPGNLLLKGGTGGPGNGSGGVGVDGGSVAINPGDGGAGASTNGQPGGITLSETVLGPIKLCGNATIFTCSTGKVTKYAGSTTAGNGFATVLSPTISQLNQSSSISSQNILTPPADGMYEVSYYILTTSAGSAGTVSMSIGWRDDSATHTTSTSISLTSINNMARDSNVVRAKSTTPITYSTTVSGASGSPKYSLFIVIQQLA